MDNTLYARVDFETKSQPGWSNNRGYGILQMSHFDNGKIINDRHMFNRVQPLTQPFGGHFPPQQTPGFQMQLNPQSDLAWATNAPQEQPK
jgi:hypothetical protein